MSVFAIILLIFLTLKNSILDVKLYILILMFVILMVVHALADEDPSAYDILVRPQENKVESFPLKLVSFYQKNISPHNGAKCLFYPTCSDFYKSALSRHGLLLGTVMFADRFFYREGIVSMKHYRYMQERERYFDPVSHNYIFKKDSYYK